ncbi:MAG: hypothetical protein SchgKO_24860 [Schleiferiaceae bacterium]
MKTIAVLAAMLAMPFLGACQTQTKSESMKTENFPVQKTEEQWKAELTAEEYSILRQKATERPFTGEYNMHFEEGTYNCAGCNAPLFSSDSKFDSHCGWPSFDAGIESGAIVEVLDKSHGMIRTEIVCSQCGGHLGHVFNDGPTETGLRYCVNSVSVDFAPSGSDKTATKESKESTEKKDSK